MIDVEECGLAAFKEHNFVLVQRLVQHQRRVNDHGLEPLGEAQEVLNNFVHADVAPVVYLQQQLVLLPERALDLLPQDRLVVEVLGTDTQPGDLVHIRRSNAAAGGANSPFAEEPLGDLVHHLVERSDQVRVGGNPQPGGVRSPGIKPVDFLEKGLKIDDDTVANDRHHIRAKDAGGKELQLVLLTTDDDGMPGVIAAVRLYNVVDPATE